MFFKKKEDQLLIKINDLSEEIKEIKERLNNLTVEKQSIDTHKVEELLYIIDNNVNTIVQVSTAMQYDLSKKPCVEDIEHQIMGRFEQEKLKVIDKMTKDALLNQLNFISRELAAALMECK